MSSRATKKAARVHRTPTPAPEKPPPPAAPGEVDGDGFPLRPTCRLRLPSGLGYQFPRVAGTPPLDPALRGLLAAAPQQANALAAIPEAERDELFRSVAKTYARANYHEFRFYELRAEIRSRRMALPGEVIWDALVEFLHFEMQAFAGASRALLDELSYIFARAHGADAKQARGKLWATADLVQRELPAGCDVPEVRILREQSAWFDVLNGFRNAFFHHGWAHGGGALETTGDSLSRDPVRNGLLIPDRESLRGRGKPFEWTWTEARTIDTVVQEIREGLDGLLWRLFDDVWVMPGYRAGIVLPKKRPNALTALIQPVPIVVGQDVYLPFFTSERRARAFLQPAAAAADLVEIVPSELVGGRRGFSLAGSHLADLAATRVFIVFDPEPLSMGLQDPDTVAVPPAATSDKTNPQPLTVFYDTDSLWTWKARG